MKDNLSGRLGPVVATLSGSWADGGHVVVYINKQKKSAVTQISIICLLVCHVSQNMTFF